MINPKIKSPGDGRGLDKLKGSDSKKATYLVALDLDAITRIVIAR